MILLDTNIVSETLRPHPNSLVVAWINAQPANALYLCAPSLAEVRFGIERLPPGRRRARLFTAVERLENVIFRDRILALDHIAAAQYGRLAAQRERAGRPIQQMDALIAAIALAYHFVLATRDTRDFADLGIDVINPFESTAPAI